ncbi:Tetratricopeptide repeat-containing protein [Loktanella fryxellensis]|uniref:Tetratricopeptide repeat-containing protein n=1 Tax=Loktanella fryxellensis TaxID=245187 RepID=A0A1H7ZQY3_9RHOB|nr:tetratricopeptide repeat-containing glycosyltransferase family protein [Loktanella fryxellensis]SEM59909.1 Tetratricopeptide repeat-containing protein [Loktanella fryxellensis]
MTAATLRASAADAHREGRLDAAMLDYARYLALVPDDAGMWSNLGALHRKAGRHTMALRAHRRALALDPDGIGTMNNAANVLSDTGDYAASLALRHRILDRHPDDLTQLPMVARCLRGMGDYGAAIAWATAALDRFPGDAELRMQLAFAQLGAGHYAAGLENYKVRWRAGELQPRDLPFPEWQGEPLEGRTIAVLTEQGFGDAVLFARFLTVLRGRGAQVVMTVKSPLQRLLQDLPGVDRIVAHLTRSDQVDYWVNMMDLAAMHFASGGDVPPPAPLHVPHDSVTRATALVAPHAAAFRVGVVWTGSVTYRGNAFRSFSHRDLLPLTDIPGVQLISLYKGPELAAYHADGTDAFIMDTGSTERDFADTAAMMQACDLVITSDTATAHIAGSLGVPVWCVLHWDAFWVYRHTGDDTPWYPQMRLFRQHSPMDWDGVMSDVAGVLRARVEGLA